MTSRANKKPKVTCNACGAALRKTWVEPHWKSGWCEITRKLYHDGIPEGWAPIACTIRQDLWRDFRVVRTTITGPEERFTAPIFAGLTSRSIPYAANFPIKCKPVSHKSHSKLVTHAGLTLAWAAELLNERYAAGIERRIVLKLNDVGNLEHAAFWRLLNTTPLDLIPFEMTA